MHPPRPPQHFSPDLTLNRELFHPAALTPRSNRLIAVMAHPHMQADAGLGRSPYGRELAARRLRSMRAVRITRFGGPEVMDVVDLPDPVPGDGEQLFDISSSGVNFADTHHRESFN